MWQCVHCDERLGDKFDVCWRCGTNKAGVRNANFTPAETSPDAPKKSQPCCPKCGSQDLMKDLRFQDEEHSSLRVKAAMVPHLLIFKRPVYGELFATVCGKCGFTELYASNPREMLAAYRAAQKGSP